jgi:hypothetical protein
MLFNTTFNNILQTTILQIETLKKNRVDIKAFEDLCTVLRQGGMNFEAEVDAGETEISFYLHPAGMKDYGDIVDTLFGMTCNMQPLYGADHICHTIIVDATPEAPAFFLKVPDVQSTHVNNPGSHACPQNIAA